MITVAYAACLHQTTLTFITSQVSKNFLQLFMRPTQLIKLNLNLSVHRRSICWCDLIPSGLFGLKKSSHIFLNLNSAVFESSSRKKIPNTKLLNCNRLVKCNESKKSSMHLHVNKIFCSTGRRL